MTVADLNKTTGGNVTRRRRASSPARLSWYALHRARRFARRLGSPQHGA